MSQPTKTVRSHDFRRTDLLERMSLQAIGGLLETFARSATQHLTSVLRQQCSFTLEKLDQVTWHDLAEELESGIYFFTFSLSPLAGRAVLAIPIEEVLAIVDLRLAGAGDDDFSGRVPSEIDQAFLAPIVEGLIGELGTALARIQASSPLLEAQEGNVQFVSIASPAEMCMAARFSFTVAGRTPSHALICLPFPMVRMLVDGLAARTSLRPGRNPWPTAPVAASSRSPWTSSSSSPASPPLRPSFSPCGWGTAWASAIPRDVHSRSAVEGLLVALAEICSSGVHKACEITEEVTR